MATFSSLPLHRKRPLDNPSGPESDGCTSKRFEMVSQEEEYRWSHPVDIAKYANENSEKFIPDRDVKEAILLKLSRPENIDPVKKLHNISLPMEVLIHAYPILKHFFSKMAVPICPLPGSLKHFLPVWRLLTKDQSVLSLIDEFKISLLQEQKQMFPPKPQK